MEQLLVQHSNASPNATAVVEGDHSVSYRELITQADTLVHQLHIEGLMSAEPVCIFLEPSYKQVVTQVAILRAGGTCVPVDPSVPALRLKDMLHDIGTRYIITSKDLAESVSGFKVLPVEIATESRIMVNGDGDIPVRAGCSDMHRTHIMFTSGSTGRPKPIQVLARGIIHVLDSLKSSPIGPEDRVSSFINPGFDFSLFETWAALLSGATIVIIPKVIITDPATVGSFLDSMKITVMIIPSALFSIIALTAPETFRGRHHILVGGEAVNVTAMKTVLAKGPPENLWNAYGPVETTIYVTLGQVDLEATKGTRISIGRPFGQTKIYLLDEQCRSVTDTNKSGEICVSGPQLSPGYLNRPDENEEQFIHVDAALVGEEGSSIRLYRTGDIGQWRDTSGALDYIGRLDKQIKRSGHRVELGDVERAIETNSQVHSCVVAEHNRGASEVLVAFVIPTSSSEEIEPSEIISWTKERLPPYMVPDQIQMIREFPLSANGKVDRNALLPPIHEGPSKEDNQEPADPGEDHWLQNTLQELLNVPQINCGDDLFALGLSSLQAAQLIGQIAHHYKKVVSLAQLHAHSTFDNLAAFIRSSNEDNSGPSQTSRWEQDSHLADDAVALPDWQSATEGRVFLTGATGFVGVHLLNHLLSMPTVNKVACLVRSQTGLSANTRIQKAMEKYGLLDGNLDKMQKIITLDGVLENETLGLDKDQFQWLANWTSVVFHVGALVNWCEPYETHFGPNVVGTRNIILLVGQGRRKSLHYLSSIDAWNVTGLVNKTERVLEDESLRPHLESLRYDMGYAQSQWVADEMVQRARARGLPVAIYRPGFIIGASKRAIGNPDDFFSRFIVGCIQSRVFPYLPRQRLEYVTVDYVCSAIVHIASKTENLGRAYHLVSPDPTQSVTIEGTYRLLKRAGYHMEQIPYQDWVEKIQQSPESPLQPMLPMLQEPVLNDLTRMQTSMETPVYDTQNTVQALADRSDIKYIPLDHELLRRFVETWVQRGDYSLPQFCDSRSDCTTSE